VSSSLAGKAFRLLYTAWCLEAGAFLSMSPWSRFWTHQVVGSAPSALQPLLHSAWCRGFVTGVGLLHVVVAVTEIEAWRRSTASRLAAPEGNGTA
jgi:hypothetical protein